MSPSSNGNGIKCQVGQDNVENIKQRIKNHLHKLYGDGELEFIENGYSYWVCYNNKYYEYSKYTDCRTRNWYDALSHVENKLLRSILENTNAKT